MSDDKVNKFRAYTELKFLFDYSYRLYVEYLNSEKKFMYALVLRRINGRIYEKLHGSLVHLNKDTHVAVQEILLHFDIWMTIWDTEFEDKSPNLQDQFTFENKVNFPKESLKQLLEDLGDIS